VLAEVRESSVVHESNAMASRAEAEALQAKVDGLAAELSSHRVAAPRPVIRRKDRPGRISSAWNEDTADYQNRRAQLEAEVSADCFGLKLSAPMPSSFGVKPLCCRPKPANAPAFMAKRQGAVGGTQRHAGAPRG